MHVVAAESGGQDLVDPRTGRIYQHAGADGFARAGLDILGLDTPVAILAARGDDLRAGADIRAAVGRVAGVQHDEARIVHPAIGVFESLAEQLLQRAAGRVLGKVERRGGR